MTAGAVAMARLANVKKQIFGLIDHPSNKTLGEANSLGPLIVTHACIIGKHHAIQEKRLMR